jgi:hypothetical protein
MFDKVTLWDSRLLVLFVMVLAIVLVAASPALAQETAASESTAAEPDYEKIAFLVVAVVSIVSTVAVVYIQNGTINETVKALQESKSRQDAIEKALEATPKGTMEFIYALGGLLKAAPNPQLADLGALMQKVSDGKPNDPLSETALPSLPLEAHG